MAGHAEISPFRRLLRLLKLDRRDVAVVFIYTALAGLLTLAIPLAAQALVNTIAAGVFVQPLVVLTTLLFTGLLLTGLLRVAQFYLVELLQQRVFARVAIQLAAGVPRVQHDVLQYSYLPELINRFFDVIKLQKSLAKLLLEGPAAMLQIVIGLMLMAIYSPLLLGFDLLIIAFLFFCAFVLGYRGVRTSLMESQEKYHVAGWLEDIARCHVSLKIDGAADFLFTKTDDAVLDYLAARRKHFGILFRQASANYLFQAFANAGILAIGGWLVIHNQLTLGQLVAAELVMVILLAAIDKLVMMAPDWYDLLTSLDKIGTVADLPQERSGGKPIPELPEGAAAVTCKNLTFGYSGQKSVLKQLNARIIPGERVSLVGASGSGKSTLAAMICGLLTPTSGVIELNGVDVREADLSTLYDIAALVDDSDSIFEGTLEENITVGRQGISNEDLRWALKVTQLEEDVALFEDGLQTRLVSAGMNISKGQIQRLLIARAIVDRPRLLILDEAFSGIDERTKLAMLQALLAPDLPWTVIDISHDADVVLRCDRVLVLEGGHIVESGEPLELARNASSAFAKLFPEVVALVIASKL
ncbi:MAG: ATP-binding cassette domain-containing protein [Vampirovibrionales bacterium]|nr:ATP-binding cassette domain-containing protein [Vampirovibrionales bacterium]